MICDPESLHVTFDQGHTDEQCMATIKAKTVREQWVFTIVRGFFLHQRSNAVVK